MKPSTTRRAAKSAGVIGALATVVSVLWFALGPRRRKHRSR
jgi:cbb3-type cytochrome oxidase subunit 3